MMVINYGKYLPKQSESVRHMPQVQTQYRDSPLGISMN